MSVPGSVILFDTNAAVFQAERRLQRAGIAPRLVPTPRQYSSDCGIALWVEEARADEAVRLLEEARIAYIARHPLTGG